MIVDWMNYVSEIDIDKLITIRAILILLNFITLFLLTKKYLDIMKIDNELRDSHEKQYDIMMEFFIFYNWIIRLAIFPVLKEYLDMSIRYSLSISLNINIEIIKLILKVILILTMKVISKSEKKLANGIDIMPFNKGFDDVLISCCLALFHILSIILFF